MPEVRATVRLQFHRDFTLEQAVPLVAYFKQLGISHIYASPLLKARPGSMHGYDVIDPTCINPEIGGEAALVRLVQELRDYDMGLVVDIVSNHMAVSDDNPWWQDVLCWGLQSPYAHFFDIQWNSPDPLLKGQLLLPFLGKGYGDVLAANEISLRFEQSSGKFYAGYFEHSFPVNPASYGHILGKAELEAVRILGASFETLETQENAWKLAQMLHQQLSELARDADVLAAIEQAMSFYDVALGQASALLDSQRKTGTCDHALSSVPRVQDNDNFQRLHQLLELQHYRLADWRTAADDINWRRFFDVNELAGLRVERPDVFEATHQKIFSLIEQGLIDGLRIDHIDGLANPRTYCRKLRRRIDYLTGRRPNTLNQDHIPIFVEKILGHSEQLPSGWNVDGTTGYEFMNQVSLLQHDPCGELQLFDLWGSISGRTGTFKDEVKEARRLVLGASLAGDVEMVAQGLLQIARTDIITRDFTLGAIRRALIELVVNFPVYRTYASAFGRSAQDQQFFNEALAGAKLTLPEADWPLLEHLDKWLGGEPFHNLPPGETRHLRQTVLARFQQLTSPAAAKAVEDTACYRSAVLLSRNDVGFNPQCFSASLMQFHQDIAARANGLSTGLLTTATHDHKRGEDTRARLAVISERPNWFAEKVRDWRAQAASLRVELPDGTAPSPGDELMLFQTLLASWPLDLELEDEQGLQDYLQRLLVWQEKSVREAKLRSNWSVPNTYYENTTQAYLKHLLRNKNQAALREDIFAAARSIAPAGALNSLSQTLLRMTTPGIPDLYQGAELWDFSLVDPDNRRPVDFQTRITELHSDSSPKSLLARWQDGHIKQWLIAKTLATRTVYPQLFQNGTYQPLTVEGTLSDKVVAFIREYQSSYLIVIVPRLCANLMDDAPLVPAEAWGDTHIVLPLVLNDTRLDSPLTASLNTDRNHLYVREALGQFPVNLFFFTVTH